MDILLPCKVIDNQICSLCKKYLSYGPVKVFKGGITCGRCNSKADEGTISIYDRIAKNLVFPCVNRYEGCNQLLRYQNIADHEKCCVGGLYQCPLCSKDDFTPNSLLYLINHYKLFHNGSILLRPNFVFDITTPCDEAYLFTDDMQNLLVIIYVHIEGSTLWVQASTVGTRIETVQYRVTIFLNCLEKFKTSFLPCSPFHCNTDNQISIYSEILPEYPSTLMCSIDFETNQTNQIPNFLFLANESNIIEDDQTNIILENYGTTLGPKFIDAYITKNFPNIYFSEELHDYEIRRFYGIPYLSWKYAKSINDARNIHMFCDFCENCFIYNEDGSYKCFFCSQKLCNNCFKKGVVNCFACILSALIREEFPSLSPFILRKRYRLQYYCQFGCNKFFYGSELRIHEYTCPLNESLDDLELAKANFGAYYVENTEERKSVIVRSNIVVFDKTLLGPKGQIYMITDFNFKCIIFYEIRNKYYRFQVAHTYSPKKYYNLNKIVEDGQIKIIPNYFLIKQNSKNTFFVVLLKMSEEYIRVLVQQKEEEARRIQQEKRRILKEKWKNLIQKFSPFIFCIVVIVTLYFHFWKVAELFDSLYTARYCIGNTLYENNKKQFEEQLRKQLTKEFKQSMENVFTYIILFSVSITLVCVLVYFKFIQPFLFARRH